MPDHAVERVGHLVGEEARQPQEQIPERRRHDAVAEVFGEALDRGAGDAVRVEARRVAADDVPHRLPPGREPAPVERESHRGHMVVEAALGDQHGDQQDLDRGAKKAAAAQPLDREPERSGEPDQHDDSDDAANPARGFAADLAVELAVEKRDGAAGQHDRMRDPAEHPGHVAEERIDGEAGDEQQQRIGGDGRVHGGGSLGRGQGRVNR